MNTISIDSTLYNSTAQYAKQHKMTIEEVVESGLKLILTPFWAKQNKEKSIWDTDEYRNALLYLDTLADGSGKPIPENEDGRDARVEKYAL